ncbi:putative NADH dehydrogenase [ubiquinone] 1 alpha subcomplex subunit 12 [Armadillidium nasatum]|uniref:NADH dehydrogenase [ubiquinone] 1 alpha subcomplex subunit 12 n=1 Tax=Armadillidium nasatum TaxID=96803 RepID=A0A5N5TFW0_9CRUS|nr:putative NADH dehydrogenase [ubiquinone] 1 alpha subcomplex subunit 12 [Armadillidium nasatum]
MSIIKYFGLDKIGLFFRIIKQHGGIRASLYKLYRMDELMDGTLVGTDNFGNKYFENKNNMFGRDRWVEYSPHVGMDYDGSQVSVEWYGWLHHKTDIPPPEAKKLGYSWLADPNQPNPTGTTDAYIPYSTTRPKVEPWIPKSKSQ